MNAVREVVRCDRCFFWEKHEDPPPVGYCCYEPLVVAASAEGFCSHWISLSGHVTLLGAINGKEG